MTNKAIRKDGLRATMPNPWKPWLIAIVAAAAVLGFAFIFMREYGLFDAAKKDTSAGILAASIVVVGAILSAVVALIGIIFKYSIDDRNYLISVEAENRNRIEVAIRAVDLLCENNKDATPHQVGGALLALVSLGELELAVSLLGTLWPARLVSPHVADVVLQRVLKDGSENVTIIGAVVLSQNMSKIDQGNASIWPIPDLGWREDLTPECRVGLAITASEWLISALGHDRSRLPEAAAVLNQALTDPLVSRIAAACLNPLHVLGPDCSGGSTSNLVTIPLILERLKTYPGRSDTEYPGLEPALERRVKEALA
ncbi:MAG: hypothetical protein IH963_05300 [Chloroflexi bacterium]|nr:hypothetical protein [Chloroflexota bacterium]